MSFGGVGKSARNTKGSATHSFASTTSSFSTKPSTSTVKTQTELKPSGKKKTPLRELIEAKKLKEKERNESRELVEEKFATNLDWFKNAKFGMFIHWGVYSSLAGEWAGNKHFGEWIMLQGRISLSDYKKHCIDKFNPLSFNPREWVQLAIDSGMKYIVFTAKHHDGFCMFDSKYTDYNIVKMTPYKSDPLKALADVCHEMKMKLGIYYSNIDWTYKDFPAQFNPEKFHGAPNPSADLNSYVKYMRNQVRELLTNYGPVDVMWFDGRFPKSYNMSRLLQSQSIIDLIHDLQPNCLVNNRLGLPGDYGTPEGYIPTEKPDTVFEVCMKHNDHWGYNKSDLNFKSQSQILRNLIQTNKLGGNFLLNVGPTADGILPPQSVSVFREVGAILLKYDYHLKGYQAIPQHLCDSRGRQSREAKSIKESPEVVMDPWLEERKQSQKLQPQQQSQQQSESERLQLEQPPTQWLNPKKEATPKRRRRRKKASINQQKI